MKPGDFEYISVSKILHFVQGAGLLNEWAKELHEIPITKCTSHCGACPSVFYSILFYSRQYSTEQLKGWALIILAP
jgi:hypothetical protein